MDILLQINDYFGTEYEIDTPWTELFAESEEQQEAMRLHRLRSCGSLESPRAAGPAMAAAVAAVLGQQKKKKAGADGLGVLLGGELLPTDEEDDSYSSGSGKGHCCDAGAWKLQSNMQMPWLSASDN